MSYHQPMKWLLDFERNHAFSTKARDPEFLTFLFLLNLTFPAVFFFFFLTSLEFHTVMENIPSCASGVVAGFHRLALIWQPVSVDVTSSLGSAAWIYTYPLILPWREDDTWSLHYCAGGERERERDVSITHPQIAMHPCICKGTLSLLVVPMMRAAAWQ